MKSTGAKSPRGQGTLTGCLAGGAASVCLISFGVVLCATGIGAIVGVLFILVGLAALCLGPLMGWLRGNAAANRDVGAFQAKCPWCGYGVLVRPKLLRSPG